MKTVFVVGGGNSLAGFDFTLLKDVDTIVVNKAIFDVPNPTHFVTIDHSFLGKIDKNKLKKINCKKHFIINLEQSYMKLTKENTVIDLRGNNKYDLSLFDYGHISNKSIGFGFSFLEFKSGENSGHSAVQLAILLGYKTIYLLGLDYNTQNDATHYHGGYGETVQAFNEKCLNYRKKFIVGIEDVKKQKIKLISLSSISALNKYIPFEKVEDVL